ncbi:esterase YqiA [Glaciecola punicea]|nr:YqiA/YcfP family alpha/beta fold hydrolase [Glaciecola punicea]OFA32565.1 esterase YqiA [Glaciecola punicea]
MHHLVYLHGFLSSPHSLKAQQTISFANKHFPNLNVHVPELPGDINKAIELIDNLLATLALSHTGFIGSSMGGFLATYCVEKYALGNSPKAVLVNPAVEPFKLLGNYLGQHVNPYTNKAFAIVPQHIVKLKQLYVNELAAPARYKVLLQTHDETLDYTLAAKKYAASDLVIEQGGNHSFVGYEVHLPSVFKFLFA